MKKDNKFLREWQEKIAADEAAYQGEIAKMEAREDIYQGRKAVKGLVKDDDCTQTPHVYNIASELVEGQINSSIPQPKISACRRENEALAKLIEDMIRNKLDKLPSEAINDQMERTVPVQGGAFINYDWDNTKHSHTTIGDGVIAFRHPKQILPQAGITSDISDMDHVTLKLPQTAEYIKRKYGIDVANLGEDDPSLRSANGSAETVTNMVTQYITYYKNKSGGVGVISWVKDIVLEDINDYQARHLRRCRNCDRTEPVAGVEPIEAATLDGNYPLGESKPVNREMWEEPEDATIIRNGAGRGRCPYCGGSYKSSTEDYMDVLSPITLPNNEVIPGGMKIPYYKPDIYPVFLQRNVSSFGKLLGDSDIDRITDQQNSINRVEAKIAAQLIGGGSYTILPEDCEIENNTKDGKIVRISDPAKKNMIDTRDMTIDISAALTMKQEYYKEAQQLIGMTDSYLGRRDTTATSGRAKEFSAAQAAGRLESKRVMKNEMYARLFEAIFKFELAYADEPRPIVGTDIKGNHKNETWDKWKFLKQDAAGEYYWETEFLFSVDSTAPLAQNREAMWQETRSHFESGAFGDTTDIETQILYWQRMEQLHYPGAAETKQMLSEKQSRQAQKALELAQAQKEAMTAAEQEIPDLGAGTGAISALGTNERYTGGEML